MKLARLLLGAGLAVVALAGTAQAQEVTLRAISAFPKNYALTTSFIRFIDDVNAKGKGIVQIQFVGGPEVIPPQQQDTALRNGVFDMQSGAASYYGGTVPEADALFGANVDPDEARKSGGYDVLNKIWRQKLNAQFLSWQSGGIGFYLYLTKEPKVGANGLLDLSGQKLRSSPAYREWFTKMGATNVVLTLSETFPAMERGVVEGLGSPGINVIDIGAQKFYRYRVGPPVWKLDVVVMVNAQKWDSLTQKQKDFLNQMAIESEAKTKAEFSAQQKHEEDVLMKAGVKLVDLPGDAGKKHVQAAHDLVWERLSSRDASNVPALRKALYKE